MAFEQDFSDFLNLGEYAAVTNAVVTATGTPADQLVGRRFYFYATTREIHLLTGTGYVYVATLPEQPGGGDGGMTPEQLALLAKAHDRNKDDKLAEGTASEVSAAALRALLDNPPSGGGGVSLSGAAPPAVSSGASAAGASQLAARGDHTHAHGNLPGGGLHAPATSSAAGFMSPADKIALDAASAGISNLNSAIALVEDASTTAQQSAAAAAASQTAAQSAAALADADRVAAQAAAAQAAASAALADADRIAAEVAAAQALASQTQAATSATAAQTAAAQADVDRIAAEAAAALAQAGKVAAEAAAALAEGARDDAQLAEASASGSAAAALASQTAAELAAALAQANRTAAEAAQLAAQAAQLAAQQARDLAQQHSVTAAQQAALADAARVAAEAARVAAEAASTLASQSAAAAAASKVAADAAAAAAAASALAAANSESAAAAHAVGAADAETGAIAAEYRAQVIADSITPPGAIRREFGPPVFSQTVRSIPDLAHYWRFGDAEGPVLDQVGGAHGTITGAADRAVMPGAVADPSDDDGALRFTALAHEIDVGAAPLAVFTGNNPFTVFGFMGEISTHITQVGQLSNLLHTGFPFGENEGVIVGLSRNDTGTRATFHRKAGGVGSSANIVTSLPLAGDSAFICAVYDGALMTLYVNGVAAGALASPAAITDQAPSARLALDSLGGAFVDEVGIVARAMSAGEVSSLYTALTTVPAASAPQAVPGDEQWRAVSLARESFRDVDEWSFDAATNRVVPVRLNTERVEVHYRVEWAAGAGGTYRAARLVARNPVNGETREYIADREAPSAALPTVLGLSDVIELRSGWTLELQVAHDYSILGVPQNANVVSAAMVVERALGRRGEAGTFQIGDLRHQTITVGTAENPAGTTVLTFGQLADVIDQGVPAQLFLGASFQEFDTFAVTGPGEVTLAYAATAGDSYTLLLPLGAQGPEGIGRPGPSGDKGWSPQFAVESDGARRVLRITGWTGGAGTPPGNVGWYVGAAGFVQLVADAIDIRGPQGPGTLGEGFDVSLSADATIPPNAFTKVAFNQSDYVVPGDAFVLQPDGSVLVARAITRLLVECNVHFLQPASGSHGTRRITRVHRQRGAQNIYFTADDSVPTATDEAYNNPANIIDVQIGDVLWVEVWHDCTNNTAVHATHTRLKAQAMGGTQGDPGAGVPAGGAAGQFLRKVSAVDLHTQWSDAVVAADVASPARALGQVYRPSTARPVRIYANVRIVVSTGALGAAGEGSVELRCDANSTPVAVRGRAVNRTEGLVNNTHTIEQQLTFDVPAGWYFTLVAGGSGTRTVTLTNYTEVPL